MSKLFCVFLFGIDLIAAHTTNVRTSLQGRWELVGLNCNGKAQTIDKKYELVFQNSKGSYVSKTDRCTQIEAEDYQYLSNGKVSIKSGNRKCVPNPCAADLPASECGKETNPASVVFDVNFQNQENKMILSTNDPKSVDCVGPGQQKPAVFTFSRPSQKP